MTTVLTEPDQTQQTTVQSTNVNLVTQTNEVQAPNPTVTITQTTTAATKTIYQKREEKAAPAVKRGIPPAFHYLRLHESPALAAASSRLPQELLFPPPPRLSRDRKQHRPLKGRRS